MNVRLSIKFSIAFIALLFVMNEAHELVHTITGRVICGCWGKRDFNTWGLCEGCAAQHPIALVATFAGPLFTFCMIGTGAWLLKRNRPVKQQSFGYAFIFANMPFARLFQPLTGGGDEVYGLNQLLHNRPLAQLIGFAIVLSFTIYPLYLAYNTINSKRKIYWFLLFFLVPVLLDHLVLLGLMNSILSKGFLTEEWVVGSPALITVWTISMLSVFILTRKYLASLFGKL